MLEVLYDILFASIGLNTHDEKANYLRGIRPTARQLWASYQTDDDATIDYSNAQVQIAYMGRYFPFYTQVIRQEFGKLLRRVRIPALLNDPLTISLFCSGPLPEAWGLSRVLTINGIVPRNFQIYTFDFHVDGWTNCRKIVMDSIRANFFAGRTVHGHSIQFDMRQPMSLHQLNIIGQSHVTVFQNCMNEISEQGREVLRVSLLEIAGHMPEGALLCLFERQGYLLIISFLLDLIDAFCNAGCEILTQGVEEDAYYDSGLRDRILSTPFNQLYFRSSTGPGTEGNAAHGLLMSAKVAYYSLIIRKLPAAN
jgi:hypothetical protein